MPELVFPPSKQTWPPAGATEPGVTKHIVRFTASRPGRNEAHGPTQSFEDICKEYQVSFLRLMEFNFALVEGEHKYFEKINWFLKHKLGCKRTTEKGNFIFSGGEEIYIPAQTVSFEPVPITLPRKTVTAIRWIQFAIGNSGGEPNYMIPGVRRESSPVDNSKLPGNTGVREQQGKGIAALVNFVATTSTSWLSHQSVKFRLDGLEPPVPKGGKGISDLLQPRGKHEAVVVAVRKTKNKVEPNFPLLPFGDPLIMGFGDVRDAAVMVERFWYTPRLSAGPDENSEIIYEYYLGTRLGADAK
jgi:hypothetical protein